MKIKFQSVDRSASKLKSLELMKARYATSFSKFKDIAYSAGEDIVKQAKRNVSGTFLSRRTRTLVNSIDQKRDVTYNQLQLPIGGNIIYSSKIGTDVPYGKYQELGYTVPAMGTPTKNGYNWMRFYWKGKLVFMKQTRQHTEPAKPWLQYAFIQGAINNFRLEFEAQLKKVLTP